jgi:cytochrome c-type biogenesis protein CcmF
VQALSQLYLPGAVALWSAVAFALAALWGYSLVLRGDEAARPFARRAYGFYALAIVLAAGVLLLALARRDFRIEYVQQYSGLDLESHFQIAAFWAGQKGSFLIWLLWGTLLGIPLARTAGRRAEAAVMGIYTLTLMGLLFILVRENPFVMLAETPADGAGLNPLLQDDWMVIHPPIMFVGYALGAVPFAFAMAALWRRDYDGWAARAFPWTLAGFLVLGAAILMGGYWAYKTLGWGGFWGWDPVENASLIPWLLMVALIHGLYLERTKGRFRRSNYILAALVYLAVLYGTFLTRSGVLADFSVHSFVDLGISGWLVALMVVFVALPAWLMATRLRSVPTVPSADPILSRGGFLVLSTLTVVTSAVVITAGTSAPLLTRFMENPGQVGPEFYNRVNLPLAILVGLLLTLVPFLTWKGEPARVVGRRLVVPGLLALAATGWAAYAAVRDVFHLVFVFLALTALLTNLQKTFARARDRGLAAAGGWLAHVGVGIMLLGFISSSAYDESAKVTLVQGEAQQVGELTLTFNRFIPRMGREKERLEVRVVRAGGDEYLAYPKMFVNDRTRQMMANPHIRSYPFQDLYLSPIEYDPGRPPGAPERVQLAKGESLDLGGVRLTFEGFDLNASGRNALAEMERGGPIVIGARDGDGDPQRVMPLYRFTQTGLVDARPVEIPGGGLAMVSGINAAEGKVQLDLAGVGERARSGEPARLSLDVTSKPLIALVWYGLYVVLAGGAIAAFQRFRQAKRLEAVGLGD